MKQDLQIVFNKIIAHYQWWHPHETVLVAVSTGADSMALLTLLQKLPSQLRPQINVAYVDHQLRAASVQETTFIKRYCQTQQLTLWQTKWPMAQHPQHGTEAAARAFRYHYFAEIMRLNNIKHLLTAHQGDDQLETLLMQLLRSGNIAQMRGILNVQTFADNRWLERPLLAFSKQQLYHFVQKRHIPYFEDATNHTDAFLRNRLRHYVVPALKKENKQVLKHAQTFANELNDMFTFTEAQIAQLIDNITIQQTTQQWQGNWQLLVTSLPLTLQLWALQKIWLQISDNSPLNHHLLNEMLLLLNNNRKPNGLLYLPHGWYFQKNYHEMTFYQPNIKSATLSPTFTLKLNQPIKVQLVNNHWQITLVAFKQGLTPLYGIANSQIMHLRLRHWQSGDYLFLSNGHHQKLRRFFINHHIPVQCRHAAWVIANDHQILWLMVGQQTHNFTLYHQDEKAIIAIEQIRVD